MAGLEARYSARDIEARILAAIRAAGLNPDQRLSPDALGALDHFHTGGLRASRESKALAQIRAEDRVLDLGAGLTGPARMLASGLGCRVDCLEMSPDYCAGAVLLNRLTGLDDRIEVHQGSALEMPFPDDTFDVVWMQNVGMNIADKRKLYGEIYRVLKPGGRFAFQEMAAGKLATSYYPEPFASRMKGREKRPLGDLFGLTNFGVNLTRLPPSTVSALRHAHSRQDEFIYILEGQPTLITDEGETLLSPGMCAGFRAGTGNGHQLVNRTTYDAWYLEVGDRTPGDSGRYPDDDLQALLAEGKWRFAHKDGRPY